LCFVLLSFYVYVEQEMLKNAKGNLNYEFVIKIVLLPLNNMI